MRSLWIRSLSVPPLVLMLVVAAVLLGGRTVASAQRVEPGAFQQTDLVSDQAGVAPIQDPDLLNPWGLVASSTSPWWVSDNNSGFSTLYSDTAGVVAKVPLTVTVPPPGGSPAGTAATPTGVVFNGNTSEFDVPGTTTAANFIFDTEDGTVSAWNMGAGTDAVLAVDNSADGAIYKGLAIATTRAGADQLYATNFGQGRIDVFDTSFAPVTLHRGAFTDPFLPRFFSPFGIQTIDGLLYVTYAVPNGSGDEVLRPGLGAVAVFTPDGRLVRQLFAGPGQLDAPWGLAVAPAGFGPYSGDLLVGNFGSGTIDAFSLRSGFPLGTLRGTDGRPLSIPGLWALEFGNGAAAGPTTSLFFTAGPNDQADGLFGTLTPAPATAPSGHHGGY